MGAGDEVHENEGVEHCKPRRTYWVDTVNGGELRNEHHEQHDAHNRRAPQQERGEIGVGVGEGGNSALDRKEHGPVWGRRFGPHRIGPVLEPSGDAPDPHRGRVRTSLEQASLDVVRVDIAAEHRRCEEEGCRPDRHDPGERGQRRSLSVEEISAEDEPGLEQDGETEEDESARDERSAGRPPQEVNEGIREQIRLERQPADSECADGEKRSADATGKSVPKDGVSARPHG